MVMQPYHGFTAEFAASVGVSYEEAGEKWRAGDALKSINFFLRAIETYRDGLEHFPMSFDLAYNRYVLNTSNCARVAQSQVI